MLDRSFFTAGADCLLLSLVGLTLVASLFDDLEGCAVTDGVDFEDSLLDGAGALRTAGLLLAGTGVLRTAGLLDGEGCCTVLAGAAELSLVRDGVVACVLVG